MIEVESKAADFLLQQAKKEGGAPTVRMIIQGGGCAGYRYDFAFGDEAEADDVVLDLTASNGEKLTFLIGQSEHELVSESTLGFDEDDFSFGLSMRMPKNYGRCGCGSSFSPPEA